MVLAFLVFWRRHTAPATSHDRSNNKKKKKTSTTKLQASYIQDLHELQESQELQELQGLQESYRVQDAEKTINGVIWYICYYLTMG